MMIRRKQMAAFEADKRRRFVRGMIDHVGRFFSRRCFELGDDAVREWVEHGVDRAAFYGLASERDVCKYIDVMFAFGRDVDRDPGCRWAAAILQDGSLRPARERADRLAEAALEHHRG